MVSRTITFGFQSIAGCVRLENQEEQSGEKEKQIPVYGNRLDHFIPYMHFTLPKIKYSLFLILV